MTPVQHFLNLTDDLICVLDNKGQVHDVNANWKNLFKLGPSHGVSFLDLVHQEHRDNIQSFFNEPRRMVMRVAECRFTDFNGQSYWLDLKIRRIPDQNRYWCLLKDITMKKHMFSLLDQISDNCNLGHWEYYSSSNSVKWSLKIYDLLELDPISFQPTMENMDLFFNKEDLHEFQKALDYEGEFDLTLPIIKEPNKWVRLRGIKEIHADGHYIIKGILQDVTKEKLKEIVQLTSNIELSSFEKGLDQFSIVARTDAKGRIIHANEEFCRISKYTEEELLGRDHRLLNSGHHPKSFFKEMWECIQEGKNWRGEIKNQAKDGSFYWVDTIIIPIRDNHGDLKEILSFRFEITNFKKEQELNQILRNKLELLTAESCVPSWSFDFLTRKMNWDNKMFEFMNKTPDFNPTFEALMDSLWDFDEHAFEDFLKNPTLNNYQIETIVNSRKTTFRVKIIRNHLGEPVRMDGIFTCKKGPDVSGPVLIACN